MDRLLVSAYKNDDFIIVDPENDWVAGDQIMLAATAMHGTHSEYRTIVSNIAGQITLDEPLDYYHYGESYSTADQFEGIDMRGEVLLLTRNVVITGE